MTNIIMIVLDVAFQSKLNSARYIEGNLLYEKYRRH